MGKNRTQVLRRIREERKMALFQQDPDRENAKDGGKLQPRFRLSLYTIAGAYLLYLAYSLFKGYPDITDSRTRMLSLMGAVLFVVVGVLIFTSLTYSLTILGIDTNLQFVFEGIIILTAVTLDCLKYVQKK